MICFVYKISPFAVDRLIISTYRIYREQALNTIGYASGNGDLKLLDSADQQLADDADWERAKKMKQKWAKEKKVTADANK